MKQETAFSAFQTTVNADPAQLTAARLRRDAFVKGLQGESDIVEVVVIGSLRRRTQESPLNDVDVVVVYDPAEYPTWGDPAIGGTALEAIASTRDRVKTVLGLEGTCVDLLNPDGGTGLHVRRGDRKRHSAKCFLDNAGADDAFTVDTVPAIRHPDNGLWIPERDLDDDDGGTWIRTDPERLIEITKTRSDSWDMWVPTVRMLKYWNSTVGAGMSSLYVEVLAQSTLPIYENQPTAVNQFFSAAEYQISAALADPTGLCGAIQPDLDVAHAKECAASAAALSWAALSAASRGDDDDSVCAWRAVFGNEFPEPPCGCDGSVAKVAAAGAAAAGETWYTQQPRDSRPRPRVVKDSPQG